jgi:D-3-phosphoglycerate dehydrogenase
VRPRVKVLNAEARDFSWEARARLAAFADVEEADLDRAGLLRSIVDKDVLIVRLGHRIDEEVMAAAPGLGAISTATTGLDHIDLESAARRGIAVLSLKGETAFLDGVTATAEHTWGLLLSLVRRIPEAVADVGGGSWRRDQFRGIELAERTLGVIGYGRLGRMVARYGVAFGMRVLVHDIALPGVLPEGMEAASRERLLAEADVISLHVPLGPQTIRLIGGVDFAAMRQGAILINTSRGEVVDGDALLAALSSGRLAGAALDVVGDERQGAGTMRMHPLITYAAQSSNLLITPHIGGATWDSMRKTEVFMAAKLHSWAREQGFAGA